MGKKFTLPKKILSAKESATDATDNPTAADSGANQNLMPASFPLDTPNVREDFRRQAAELKKKIGIGATPERLEKPKTTFYLKKDGTLGGEIISQKQEDKSETLDLSKQASAVNEGIKRPVFTRKANRPVSSNETTVGTASKDSGIIKDERESKDKQPKEAVACEGKLPAFNNREQALINNGDEKAIRRAMANGTLSKARGRQILYTIGAVEEVSSSSAGTPVFGAIIDWLSDHKTAFADCVDYFNISPDQDGEYSQQQFAASGVSREDVLDWISEHETLADDYNRYFKVSATEGNEGVSIPKSTDMGTPLEQPVTEAEKAPVKGKWTIPSELSKKLVATDTPVKENLEAYIDTEIGDVYNCPVTYTSRAPLEGQISRLDKTTAQKIVSTLESIGVKARMLAAKEEVSVLFTEEEPVNTTKWYALVVNKNDPSRISQLTLTVNTIATETEVTDYLVGIYGKEGVLKVSPTKIS